MGKTFQPLDEVIEKSGRTYKFIAKNMGISENMLYKWRRAPNKMTLEKVIALSKAAGVNDADVFNAVKKF